MPAALKDVIPLHSSVLDSCHMETHGNQVLMRTVSNSSHNRQSASSDLPASPGSPFIRTRLLTRYITCVRSQEAGLRRSALHMPGILWLRLTAVTPEVSTVVCPVNPDTGYAQIKGLLFPWSVCTFEPEQGPFCIVHNCRGRNKSPRPCEPFLLGISEQTTQ